MREVAITGIGAVCAIAGNCDELWTAIEAGECGIAPIRRFSTRDFDVHTGALVAPFAETRHSAPSTTEHLCRTFAENAGREAVNSATLAQSGIAPHRIGFVFGTGLGDLDHAVHEIAEAIAETLGARGPRITVSTACSSSTGAIGVARDLLASGAADAVIAGGADVLTPEVFAGFHALGVLSTSKCAPFSFPVGTTLGEGAGFMVLERTATAAARAAIPVAYLAGYAMSGDAWHETSPHPKGIGIERVIRGALEDADLRATDVDYVNTHGSGTEANDAAEWRGIQSGLGAHARDVPVSSSKGALGHAQGAAGVLESIVTLLAMRRGAIPPTLNFAGQRPYCPVDSVPEVVPRLRTVHHALSLNSAFGGANVAVALSLAPRSRPDRPRARVELLGAGVTGFGAEACARLEDLLPACDTRALDATGRYLTTAAALGLANARVAVHGALRDRTGLIVGQLRASPSNMLEFHESIAERGLRNLSAVAFARVVLNAAAGSCSKLLSLRGPLTAITTGGGSGLAAIALAAEILSRRTEVDFMVAGGVDEHVSGGPSGAACVVLGKAGASGHTPDGAGSVFVGGWGFAGHGRLDEAVALARAEHAFTPDVDVRIGNTEPEDTADASAVRCVNMLLEVVKELRCGSARSAIVGVDTGRSIATALLLVAA